MPVGQVVGRMERELPVAEVVATLVRECEVTIERLRELAEERAAAGERAGG
jgi:hypothetical protein